MYISIWNTFHLFNVREDTDVRMLGQGRDFLVQVRNPRIWQSEIDAKAIQKRINEAAEGKVVVRNLQILGRGHAEMANITKAFHQVCVHCD